MGKRKLRLCVIANPPIALTLLRRQWTFWIDNGFEPHCITGPEPQEHEKVHKMGVKTYVVPMERYPNPFKDLISMLRIWWILLWHRFDIIHISSPKASFLGALAARLSGHRRLFYLVRGRAYENFTGWRRKMMNTCEWLTCNLSSRVVPICNELGQMLVDEGLCPPEKICVVGSGSSAGVDLNRFARTGEKMAVGREIRKEFGIKPDDLVILFVGWIRRDKGINELVDAFEQLSREYPHLHLLLLGNYELSDPLEPNVIAVIENHPHIHHLLWRVEPADVYTAADIVAFPSYREGFGNVAMEASAMELPVVASDIMGCREAVQAGLTGLLVPKADTESLRTALKRLIDEPELRKELGQNGRHRVEREFRQEIIWQGHLKHFYEMCAMETCLENSEVLLRKLRVSDLFEVFKNIKNQEVGKWTGPPRRRGLENFVGRFICRMGEHALKGLKMIWHSLFKPKVQKVFRLAIVLKETDTVIGIVSLTKGAADDDFADLGFWIGKKYWGRGLMSRILPLVISFGFEELELDKITAWTFEENVGSKKVMEKCGFKKDGVRENAYVRYGENQNRIDYVIHKSDCGEIYASRMKIPAS